ncbi:hypothetical protein H6G76_21400 [Nostoc sp. FACHB-152]|nr:hypothetical protein [Nostoc sp. FACHB-152]MBD2469660.1 hypothetical protein [Nostoc sp. FACHB-145]
MSSFPVSFFTSRGDKRAKVLACRPLNAIALHGREKLDEAGLADVTDLVVLSNHKLHLLELNPEELGFNPVPTSTLRGGNVQENAEILKAVLQGKGTQSQLDVVTLNTALALFVGEVIPETDDYLGALTKCVVLAREVLQSGAAWAKLEQLTRFLQ